MISLSRSIFHFGQIITHLLYEGKIFPTEQYSPRSEEYRKIHQEYYHHYEDFIETLSKLNPPLNKRFIEIIDEQLDVISYKFSEMFIGGFRLGARIIIDILQGDLGIREIHLTALLDFR